MIRFICVFALLFSLTSCGYHFGDGGLPEKYRTISVPFAVGDWNGDFTTVLIEQIARTGCYTYCKHGGALILKVSLMDFDEEHVGFSYNRKKSGRVTHSIIPTETRAFMTAEVTLIEASTGNAVLGPARITASVDYDHDYYSTPERPVNVFSLGQLNDYDTAYDAVNKPLNRAMAKKIVDFVVDSW